MVQILIGILLVAALVALFIFTYMINKKTPKPEGCQNMDENCEGCQILSCSHRQNENEENKGEK